VRRDVDDGIRTRDRARHRGTVEDIDPDGLAAEVAQERGLRVAARHAAHTMTVLHHPGDGRSTDLTGCSYDEDVHRTLLSSRVTG
jgi:hypothetical protein